MPAQNTYPLKAACARLFAFRLRQLRRSRGLTQEEVAQRAGIATYTYQKFEKGESKPGTPANPGLYTLVSLANAFEITLPELVTYDGLELGGRGTHELPGSPDADESPSDAPLWLGGR